MEWGGLYLRLGKLLMPDVGMDQLMVSTEVYQENMQLFLNSMTYM
jgi:hypothetical protein